MAYLINIKENNSNDVSIYCTFDDITFWPDIKRQDINWFRVGGLSSVKLNLNANDFVYKPIISFTVGFLNLTKCESPDINGVNICTLNGYGGHNIIISYNDIALPCIQELDFEVDAETKLCKFELTLPEFTKEESESFCREELKKVYKKLPSWVSFKWIKFNESKLNEIGTDGHIEYIHRS